MFSSNKLIFVLASTVLLLISNVSTEITEVVPDNDDDVPQIPDNDDVLPIPDGDEGTRTSRIIGGRGDMFDEIRYTVALHDGYQNFCGGSIINEYYVLTAAHCVIGHENEPIQNPLYALIGGTKLLLSSFQDRVPKVEKIFVPSSFDGSRGSLQFGDIAVLRVDRMIHIEDDKRISRVFLPKKLPDGSWDDYEGKLARIAGLGANAIEMKPTLEKNAKVEIGKRYFPGNLIIGQVDVMPQRECEDIYAGFIHIHEAQMCGRMLGNDYHGICTNDEGIGLIWNNTIIGVASFGNELCNESAGRAPAVYTRVAPYIFLIEMAMNNVTGNELRVYDMMK